jgi:hypothetical protein
MKLAGAVGLGLDYDRMKRSDDQRVPYSTSLFPHDERSKMKATKRVNKTRLCSAH